MTTTAEKLQPCGQPLCACEPVAQPITPADRCAVAGGALAGAADQLWELACQLEHDPDLPLPRELQLSGIGPLQLHGVARWLGARASLYGAEMPGAVVAGFGEL